LISLADNPVYGFYCVGKIYTNLPTAAAKSAYDNRSVFMTLKQIFKIKFILIIKYLPVIGKSHLPPRYSINIFVYILKEY